MDYSFGVGHPTYVCDEEYHRSCKNADCNHICRVWPLFFPDVLKNKKYCNYHQSCIKSNVSKSEFLEPIVPEVLGVEIESAINASKEIGNVQYPESQRKNSEDRSKRFFRS